MICKAPSHADDFACRGTRMAYGEMRLFIKMRGKKLRTLKVMKIENVVINNYNKLHF
jgi:hypothetical protein